MNVQELVEGARDVLSVKRVFGEPYERNGVTIIPAASFGGGAGGGGDNRSDAGGSGGGFGLGAKPAGAYVIKDGVVSWQPALDINRIISAVQIVLVAGLFAWRSVVKARAKREG
jgi:uncharacterized spore protein YtfJ